MSDTQPDSSTKDAAREALLTAIASNASDIIEELHPSAVPGALKDLAEAYAFVVSPNNAH